MGRMEGLIGLALGRSPYDELVVNPINVQEGSDVVKTGQRYDDHGRPINSETRQRMRDHIRASNEVMQAAGIIEETADVRARDKAFKETLDRETEIGLRRLEFGRVLLVAGVWGVCGFRRRILLYKDYPSGLLDIIRYERTQYSALHMLGAGLSAMAVYQGIEWLGLLCRAAISGPYESSKSTDRIKAEYMERLLRRMFDYGFGYVMLNYQMFAILQQLNMWPSSRLLPSLRSLIPFSAYSPLQLPPLPSSLSTAALLPWATALFLNIAPLGIVLVHSVASSFLSSLLYGPVYSSLPKARNPKSGHLFPGMSSDPEAVVDVEYDDVANAENHDPLRIGDGESPAPHTSAAPSQHTATLQALEGRRPNIDDSSDDDDHEMSQQTLITFDVEATEMTEATMGTWSAELRSANEPTPKEKVYHVSALTMLPPLLAAEGLSAILTEIGFVILPVEAIMVRTVARGYRRSAGLGAEDLFEVFSYRNAWIKIFVIQTVELAVTGALWAAFSFGSHAMSGMSPIWNSTEEADKED